jgi:3-oxoacyl-[acyl-carrier-protein] synthase-1
MYAASRAEDPIVVTGVGAVAATGHDAPTVFTSVKAGLARIGESSEIFIRDEKRRRLVVNCASAAGVTDGHRRFLRLYRLAVRAFGGAVAHSRLQEAALSSTQIHVALAEPARPGLDDRAESQLAVRISRAMGVDDLSSRTAVICAGHAGAFEALDRAVRAIAQRQCAHAIVGGVDTYLDELSLQWLFDSGRLKTERTNRGFVPGEAAAFVVIERESTATKRQAGRYARLQSVVNAFENHGFYESEPCTADGLTQSIRNALEAADQRAASLVICDLNGERHRAHEWGLAMSRCFPGGTMPEVLWHPADTLGDTGAASGALNLVLATLAVARGNASGSALVWGSSDDGERGAAVLSPAVPAPYKERPSAWA